MSSTANPTILITGVAGFVGSHLAEYYLSSGCLVIGVDNLLTGSQANIDLLSKNLNFRFTNQDVTQNWQNISDLYAQLKTSNLKYVFHFASPAAPAHYQKYPLETLWANSIGLQNAINFADQHQAKVVFASTSEIYGDPVVSPQNENYWGFVNSFGDRSCYDEAKRFGEALIYTANKTHSKRHGIVRIFNTYGPRMNPSDGRVITNLITQAIQNKDLTIYGKGAQTRSFCFISDLVKAIALYAEHDINVPVNIGNDEEFSINDLAQIILKKTSSKSQIFYAELPKDDPQHRRPDLTRAKQLLTPWKPEIGLDEGLEKMIEWLSANYKSFK